MTPGTGSASPSPSGSGSQLPEASSGALGDLDQVAAAVVEDGRRDRAHGEGLLGELDTKVTQAFELGLDVVDSERRVGDAVLGERRLQWPGGRVPVGLEQ